MDATFLMNFVAPLLLGLAIGYLLWRTQRPDWRQRARSEKATEDLYERTEDARRASEPEEDETGSETSPARQRRV